MQSWQEDMLNALEVPHLTEDEIFGRLEVASQALGFSYCAYGLRVPVPVTRPETVVMNNYPEEWQKRYHAAGYLSIDPTLLRGCKSQAPIIWSDDLFSAASGFWGEARDAGLRVGWAQSSLDGHGLVGMVTLARSHDDITCAELADKGMQMRWLANSVHWAVSRRIAPRLARPVSALTPREVEVLQWTAD